MTTLQFEFINKHKAAKILKVHPNSLARYRRRGQLIEGIHYTRMPQQVLYNKPLLEDWVANRHDPPAHQRAIEIYRASLLSNKSKRQQY
ncbi:MAG: hypothetical protein F6K19_30535 [Cyanothece sp. SIO1E1]|nr:hypothetical protein [Cyanothece sp. SIO1E1]